MMSDMNQMRRRNPMTVHYRQDRTTADARTRRCPATSATRANPVKSHTHLQLVAAGQLVNRLG
jgi:hypothetical protein